MRLVLLRHGHSEWNLTDRFTGWTDIALTEVGLAEARAAGRALARAGLGFDAVHVSALTRTRQTAEAVLAGMLAHGLPVHASWRLNERHYGALQGMRKQDIFAIWGEASSRRWWRGVDAAPPPLAGDDPRHPRFDPRYAGLELSELPTSESLRDCQRRLLPYWDSVLAPALCAGKRLLVVSHGNTIRALFMHLYGLDEQAMMQLEIPSGVPCVVEFDDTLRVLGRSWLER